MATSSTFEDLIIGTTRITMRGSFQVDQNGFQVRANNGTVTFSVPWNQVEEAIFTQDVHLAREAHRLYVMLKTPMVILGTACTRWGVGALANANAVRGRVNQETRQNRVVQVARQDAPRDINEAAYEENINAITEFVQGEEYELCESKAFYMLVDELEKRVAHRTGCRPIGEAVIFALLNKPKLSFLKAHSEKVMVNNKRVLAFYIKSKDVTLNPQFSELDKDKKDGALFFRYARSTIGGDAGKESCAKQIDLQRVTTAALCGHVEGWSGNGRRYIVED